MPNPAASLPAAYAALARLAASYGDVDPAHVQLLRTAAINWAHPDPRLQSVVAAIHAQHPDFAQQLPMATWEKILGIGVPAALFAAPLVGLGGGSAATASTGPNLAGLAGTGLEGTAGLTSTAVSTGAGATAGAVGAGVGAGAVAPSVAHRITNWLSPLVNTAIPVAGQVLGAHMQSTGIKEAAEIQAKSIAEALGFEKQQYGDLVGRLTPYIASGATSTDRMAQLLGLPPRASTTAAPWPGSAGPPAATRMAIAPEGSPAGPAPVNPSAGPVLMRAPDGSTQAVAPSEVDHYRSRGATVVTQ